MDNHKNLLALILILGFTSINISGQDSSRPLSKEIYLTGKILDFTNLGLEYKSEIKENTFFRMGINNLSLNLQRDKNGDPNSIFPPTKRYAVSGRYEFGIEKRKIITDKLQAFYGIDIFTWGSFYRHFQQDPSLPYDLRFHDNLSVTPGFSFKSGLILKISDAFSIAAEIAPEIFYSFGYNEKTVGNIKVKDTSSNGIISISNQNVWIAFVYKWDKK